MTQSKQGWNAYGFIYSIAQSQLLRPIIVWGIAHMSNFIPNQVIRETESLTCFYHPRPDYPIHILLVPKEEIHDVLELDPEGSEFLQDVFITIKSLVKELNLGEQGYRVVVNGGSYQDFPQLHFHLISGE